MRIRLSQQSGSALIVCLCVAGITGVALVAYLSLVSNENVAVARSQSWNAAMPIVEAGLEEALAHLNANSKQKNLQCCGWSWSGTKFIQQRNWGDGYYVVSITSNRHPVIVSRGFAPIPLTTNYLSRTVMVTCTNLGGGGVTVKSKVDLNGNSIVIDSFDSTDPSSSTAGIYDPAKRRDGARVKSELGIQNAVNVGNADIWGTVAIAPGGTVYTGPMGSVGDLAWHNAGNIGVQPDAVATDASVTIPDPPAPPGGAVTPIGLNVGGITVYTLGDGVWVVPSMQDTFNITGNATLIVNGVAKTGAANPVTIAPNASLTLFVYGSMQFGGGNLVNSSGMVTNLTIYGMSTCTSIDFNGGTTFTGVILAPTADVTAGGGGGTFMNLIGSLQAKSFTMSGKLQLHYDEALNPKKPYSITSWNEL